MESVFSVSSTVVGQTHVDFGLSSLTHHSEVMIRQPLQVYVFFYNFRSGLEPHGRICERMENLKPKIATYLRFLPMCVTHSNPSGFHQTKVSLDRTWVIRLFFEKK